MSGAAQLKGVVIHSGTAQSGHYYSLIQDRSPAGEGQWYMFDDRRVSPFKSTDIPAEAFGTAAAAAGAGAEV